MSFSPYPEYKDSGLEWVGEVPSDWESWKIAHAFKRIGSGTTPPSTEGKWYEDGEIPWITTGELRENVVTYTKKSVTREALRAFPALRLHSKGALAMAMYGATIGRLGILGVEATTNQACSVMESSTDLAVKFVFYWLHCNRTTIVALFSTGGGQPNINQEAVTSLRIPAPTLTVQTHIARFLDHETAKINALIREQERLIELLQEKRQAVISHAVTKGLDPDVPMKDSEVEWLGEVPAHWEVAALKHLVIEPLKYGANEAAGDSNLDNPRFVRITDVTTEGTLREDTYRSLPPDVAAPYMLSEGDILLARSGATVGKAFIYRGAWGQCCFAGYLIKASADQEKVSPDFVYFVLQSSSYWQYIGQEQIQATIQNVSAERYGNFVLTFPTLHEQKSIIEYLQSKLDEYAGLLDVSKKTVKLLIERRSALISAAVTGKIDVRNWQPPVDESAFDEEVGQAGLETTV